MLTKSKKKLAMNLNLIALFCLGFLLYLVTTLEDKGINKDKAIRIHNVITIASTLESIEKLEFNFRSTRQ